MFLKANQKPNKLREKINRTCYFPLSNVWTNRDRMVSEIDIRKHYSTARENNGDRAEDIY